VTTEARQHFTAGLLELSKLAIRTAEELGPDLERALGMVQEAVAAGGTLFFCGNGGSAADAQHMATNTSFATCARGARILRSPSPPTRH
jgi:phosphoheptose isomerase